MIKHNPFDPVYNKNSKVLILGTMPSPKSIEYGFYYGHPQNRFWKIIHELFGSANLNTIEEKKSFLLKNKIALWDVLASCIIKGADDASIRDPIVNDISSIISESSIQHVFTTGNAATKLYDKYCYLQTNIPTIKLPSTSPANCRYYNFETIKDKYKIIKYYL